MHNINMHKVTYIQ